MKPVQAARSISQDDRSGLMPNLPVTSDYPGMTIFWDGMLLPGLNAYGVRHPERDERPVFPAGAWGLEARHKPFSLVGVHWSVTAWHIQVGRWPEREAWPDVVRATLRAFIDVGATVAWLGTDILFCDPPELFDPGCMPGRVLAALTAAGEFTCRVGPNDAFGSLSDEEMLGLKVGSGGLADASE